MGERIYITIDRAEKERFRRMAARKGQTLGEWLRDAAREQLALEERFRRLDSTEALAEFFADCEERELEREPDWEAHRRVIERSMASGLAAS